MPIEPEYPAERIKFILKDSDAVLLLTQTKFKDNFKVDIETIYVDDENYDLACGNNPPRTTNSNNLAYVIYTSGSTGNPKGVMIEHHSVVNRILWMQRRYPINVQDVIMQKTTFVFDVSVWELFWWPLVGAKVYLLGPNKEKNSRTVLKAIKENKVSVMHFVPSILELFLDYLDFKLVPEDLKSLRLVFSSGESLSPSTVNRFNSLLFKTLKARLTNLYGPTEATVDVSYFECSSTNELNRIPIGRPIQNIRLYILDKNNQLLPINIPGELHIAGEGLARGYLNRENLSKEKFIDGAFLGETRLYKTGDQARWLKNGDIEYLGRLDNQVKIRGLRMETGEIEHHMLSFKGVKKSIVLVREDGLGNKYLCGYIVSDRQLDKKDLITHLANKLPIYMIPSCFVALKEVPVTINGKVNKKALLGIGGI